MGLLDNLQLEVDRIKAEQAKRNAQLQAQELFYDTQLKPVMLRASSYFSDIVEKLNIVSPDISVSYPLHPNWKHGIALQQANYKFRTDSGQTPHQIDILCSCGLEKPHEFYVPTKKGALKHAELLDGFGFPHHRKNKLDKFYDICGATFILEGPLKVHIRILARAADKCIYFVLRNIDGHPGPKLYKYSPDAVDQELLERLAKVFVREVPLLVETRASDAVRNTLRNQLEIEKQREQDHWNAVNAVIEAEEQLAEENTNLANRTKRAILERFGLAVNAFRKT